MTATPKETSDVSSKTYFGEPIYTYSLKQGILDGFLAPYKVIRYDTDKDREGLDSKDIGQADIYGTPIPVNIKQPSKDVAFDVRFECNEFQNGGYFAYGCESEYRNGAKAGQDGTKTYYKECKQ